MFNTASPSRRFRFVRTENRSESPGLEWEGGRSANHASVIVVRQYAGVNVTYLGDDRGFLAPFVLERLHELDSEHRP